MKTCLITLLKRKKKKKNCYGRDFCLFNKSHLFFLQGIWLDYTSQASLQICGVCDWAWLIGCVWKGRLPPSDPAQKTCCAVSGVLFHIPTGRSKATRRKEPGSPRRCLTQSCQEHHPVKTPHTWPLYAI